MAESIYQSWELIAGISSIAGLLSATGLLGSLRTEHPAGAKDRKWSIARSVCFIVALIFLWTSLLAKIELTSVPPINGLTMAEAKNELSKAGLKTDFPSGFEKTEDFYLLEARQSIDEGSIVLKGTPVMIYPIRYFEDTEDVSGTEAGAQEDDESGKDVSQNGFVTVPDVVGKEQNEATELLTSLGLEFQVWWEEQDNVEAEKYYIADQSIPQAAEVPKGTLIKLQLTVKKP